jgi:regulator of extracellular matrix RemA (YlzA/DUF370 family)
MATELVHVGFGNVLAVNRLVATLAPGASPTKRLVQEARERGLALDLTSGRRMKTVVVLEGGFVALLAITAETLANRLVAARTSGQGSESSDDA